MVIYERFAKDLHWMLHRTATGTPDGGGVKDLSDFRASRTIGPEDSLNASVNPAKGLASIKQSLKNLGITDIEY